jgi:putative resolvase
LVIFIVKLFINKYNLKELYLLSITNGESKFIPLHQAVQFTGVKSQTLRAWAKQGKIKTYKTPSGQLLYDKQNILIVTDDVSFVKEKKSILYARVSSKKQLDDLERQCEQLRTSFPLHELITDCGSGINWSRHGLKTILELAMSNQLTEVVIAHRDRLCRFAFELIEWIINSRGGKIIVLDKTEDEHQSSEQELAEDILSIVHIYSCKQMGRRRYSKNLKDKVVSNNTTNKNITTMVSCT